MSQVVEAMERAPMVASNARDHPIVEYGHEQLGAAPNDGLSASNGDASIADTTYNYHYYFYH